MARSAVSALGVAGPDFPIGTPGGEVRAVDSMEAAQGGYAVALFEPHSGMF